MSTSSPYRDLRRLPLSRCGVGVIACAFGLFAQTPDKPASLTGAVTNTLTGEPIPRVHVTLSGGVRNGTPLLFGAMTTAEGRFSIDGITPGQYNVSVERVGFVAPDQMGSSTRITLQADEKKTDAMLKLTPTGAITGQVTGSDGEPVEGANVTAEGTGIRLSVTTDDKGQFRIGGLTPGRYRVKSASANRGSAQGGEIRTDGTEEVHNATTYFPGTLDAKTASRVEVRGGGDASGVDIRMIRAPLTSVTGRVTGVPPGADRVRVEVSSARGYGSSALVRKDGTFELWRLDPGKYTVTAWAQGARSLAPDFRSAGVEVEVGSSNIEGIELRMVAPADIAGLLEFDDDQAKQMPQPPVRPNGQPGPPINVQRRVSLFDLKTRGSAGIAAAVVSADNAFRLVNVGPGRYRVTVTPSNVYVKSMRFGSAAIDGSILDLSTGAAGGDLSVLLSSATGSVSGIVHDDNGNPAGTRIVLVPADGDPRKRYATAGADGSWSIDSLAPGSYRIVAVQESDNFIVMQQDGLDSYEDAMESIDIHPGDKIAKDLKQRKFPVTPPVETVGAFSLLGINAIDIPLSQIAATLTEIRLLNLFWGNNSGARCARTAAVVCLP